ncbi:MAG TPA: FG-GAP repeat protein, partial [Mycobacteriales bacterium]
MLTGICLAGSSIVVLVGGTTTPALAAAGCVTADTYQHHELDPGKAAASFVSGAKFGAATVIGDFNRDGFGDVAVGAPAD